MESTRSKGAMLIQVALCLGFSSLVVAASSQKEQTRQELRNNFDQVKNWIADAKIQPNQGPIEVSQLVYAALVRDFSQDAKYPGARQAVSLIVEASKVNKCDDRTLELLKKIALGSDRAADRYENIWSDYVNYFAHWAAKHCDNPQLLASKFITIANATKDAEYLRELAPVGVALIGDDAFLIDPATQAIQVEDETWARIVEKLAEDMSSDAIVAQFDRVYEERLAAPCAKFVASPVGEFADTIDGLGYFVGGKWAIRKFKPLWDFYEKLPGDLQDNLFRLYVCQAVVLDKVDKAQVKQFIADYGQNN